MIYICTIIECNYICQNCQNDPYNCISCSHIETRKIENNCVCNIGFSDQGVPIC